MLEQPRGSFPENGPKFSPKFVSLYPDNPYPPTLGGGVFTPQIWAVGVQKYCKTSVFLTIHPPTLGAKFHPPNLGGMGCQGIMWVRKRSPQNSHQISRQIFREKKRHININFLLWLTSRWPWDKRLVVPGLTGPKSLCVRLETQEIWTFPSG